MGEARQFASESEARGWLAGQEPVVPPYEDESLPPQLCEALRIMSRRGRVVEISAAQVLARREQTGEGDVTTETDAVLRERIAEALRVRLARVHGDPATHTLEPEDVVEYIGVTEYELADALLPVIEAEVEAARLTALQEPQPARPADDGVARMYAERRADEFARLRARISEVAGPGADVDQVLALRELRRPFEERDRLRGNAQYWIDYACAYAEARDRAEAERVRLAAEVEALRTEVTKRQEYLEKLRGEAGRNYGDAKKLRRWLDEERESVKAYCEETDAAEAKLARVRALHQPMQRAGTTNCAHCSGWNGTRCLGVVTPWPCPTLAGLDGTGEA